MKRRIVLDYALVVALCLAVQWLVSCNETPVKECAKVNSMSVVAPEKAVSEIQRQDIDKPPLLTLNLGAGRVDILAYTLETSRRQAIFDLRVYNGEVSSHFRRLIIDFFQADSRQHCWKADLFDSLQNLKWSLKFEADEEDSTHFWLTEKTIQDELIIEQLTSATSLSEIYTLNGIRNEINFPTADVGRISAIRELIYSDNFNANAARVSPIDLEIAHAFRIFNNTNDTTNSLYRNIEGNLLVELITNRDLALRIFIDHRLEITGSEEIEPTEEFPWRIICQALTVCVQAKCPFIEINPACELCVGGIVICAIAKAYNLW